MSESNSRQFMPLLETERLIVRPFAMGDLDDIHRILDMELSDVFAC